MNFIIMINIHKLKIVPIKKDRDSQIGLTNKIQIISSLKETHFK